MMHNLVRPKFFMPVHGEYRHLVKHAQLAQSLGMPRENIVIGENGAVIELTRNSIGISGRVPAGKILVDGLGVGDVGNIVLRDRRQLSQDGIMIVVVTIEKIPAILFPARILFPVVLCMCAKPKTLWKQPKKKWNRHLINVPKIM